MPERRYRRTAGSAKSISEEYSVCCGWVSAVGKPKVDRYRPQLQRRSNAATEINEFFRRRALTVCRKDIFDIFPGVWDANHERLFGRLADKQIRAIHKTEEFLELLLDDVNLIRQNAPSPTVCPFNYPRAARQTRAISLSQRLTTRWRFMQNAENLTAYSR